MAKRKKQPDTREIQTGIVYREASIRYEKRADDEDPENIDRRAEISFSSEHGVERWFGMEVLDHSRDSVDLSFLDSGNAPLLLDHDTTRQIGVIESASVGDDRQGRANVRFSRSALATEVLMDVEDDIRGNVSVGYRVNRMVLEETDEAGETYRVVDWTPMEISMVSIPADPTVGVGRSESGEGGEMVYRTIVEDRRQKKMPEKTNDDDKVVDIAKVQNEARQAETARVGEILAIASKYDMREAGDAAVKAGDSVDTFRQLVLEKIGERQPEPVKNDAPSIEQPDLTEAEQKRFSVVRLLRSMLPDVADNEAAFERGICAEFAKRNNLEGKGIILPYNVLMQHRTLNTGTPTGAAELVGTDHRGDQFIEYLRNNTRVMAAGARMLTGLVGNVDIPRQDGSGAATWVDPEGSDTSNNELVTGVLQMSPKDVGNHQVYTRRLLLQSDPSIDVLVRDDLLASIAVEIDRVAHYGTGAAGQPTGISNTAGINVTNFGVANAPTWAEVVDMKGKVDTGNALRGSLNYFLNAAMVAYLQTTPREAGEATYIMGDDDTRLAGYPAQNTNQIAAGDMFFGNYSDLLIGMWGGLDLTVDPYTLSISGSVRVTGMQTIDVGVRHAVSFTRGYDAGP